jgi:hypothetical protein
LKYLANRPTASSSTASRLQKAKRA